MFKITFLAQSDELSKLAERIAHQHNGYVVPDYEKEYREMVNRELSTLDYYRIAKGMLNKELEYENTSKKFLISINNPYLIYNKSLAQSGDVHPKFTDVINQCKYDYVLLPNNNEFNTENIEIKNIKQFNIKELEDLIKNNI